MKEIEQVERGALREMLAYVLAVPGVGKPAGAAQVDAYVEYLSACRLEWEAHALRRAGGVSGLALVLFLPGRTAVVMLPAPGENGIDPADQARAISWTLERLGSRKLYYAQALVEPEAEATRALLARTGFRHLARLHYLEQEVRSASATAPGAEDVTWVPYSDETADAFAATLSATYEDTLDCPELTGLRPIEDVIASHAAAGVSGSQFWEVVREKGRNAGCLLLSAFSGGALMEVVYMGVVPGFRRRGLGVQLVQRALERAAAQGAQRLLIVVDERNGVARRLYEGGGFEPVAVRDVYLYRWGGGS